MVYCATKPKYARKHRNRALVLGCLACVSGGSTPKPNAKLNLRPRTRRGRLDFISRDQTARCTENQVEH